MSEKLVITRKRKKYKFAKFDEFENCFQFNEWLIVIASGAKQFSNITLEVGAGTGLFIVQLAQKYPKKIFVAVDIKSDRLYTGAKLANELGLDNIVFVRSSVDKFLETLPKKSVSEIWITFPDPFATEDQTSLTSTGSRKRLTSPKFLKSYKRIIEEDGRINFKTDNEPLFDWSVKQFEDGGWAIRQKTTDLHNSNLEDDKKMMTTYEKRFITQGLPIFYLSATIKE